MIIDISPTRLKEVAEILTACELPVSDLDSASWLAFIGWLQDDRLEAVAGIEECDGMALLRSVATAPDHRGSGLASKLVGELHRRAASAGFSRAYLLTLDAGEYFEKRFGYQEVDRSRAPLGIVNSKQFSSLCPDTAQLMEVGL